MIMSLLTLLIAVIAMILYVFAIKWICAKMNAAEYTYLFIGLGVVVFVLFLCRAFGIFDMLSSVKV